MGKRREEKEFLEELEFYGADPDILREWDLAVERVRPVRGVLKIKTPSGTRMLKKINTSEARLRFIHEAIEHLAANGFPHVPRFIRTKYGDPYVVHPTGLYYLTDWFPGKEADLKKPKNVFLAAETLARFHNAGLGYEGGGFGQETREDFSGIWGKYKAKLDSYDQSLEDTREENAFHELYREHRSQLTKMIDHAVGQLNESPYGRVLEWARDHKTICHGSFSRQNLIVDKEKLAIVDFDHCHFGHPIHDLGAFLARYMPRFDWDAEIGFSILDVYRAVRELSAEEMTVLAAYLSFPQRSLQLVESYFENTRDWDAGKFANRFRKSLALDNGRETFVQELIDRYGLKVAAPSFAPQLEGIESYQDLDDLESSSVETRDDGWEEDRQRAHVQGAPDVQSAGHVTIEVEEEEPNVTLAGYQEEEEEHDHGQGVTSQASQTRKHRPKQKRSTPDTPRRRPHVGPWMPDQE